MATIIPKKHQEFIRLVANGTPQNEAYRATSSNPKATAKTAKEQGSKLARRYAKEILEAKEKASKLIEEANNSEASQNALKSILTQAEVDKILTDIISGQEFEAQQLNITTGKLIKSKVRPTIAERRAAIETYNKRFGSNIDVKQHIQVDGETKKYDFTNLSFEQLMQLADASRAVK